MTNLGGVLAVLAASAHRFICFLLPELAVFQHICVCNLHGASSIEHRAAPEFNLHKVLKEKQQQPTSKLRSLMSLQSA